MMRLPRSDQRGFTMIIVVVLVSVIAMVGISLIQLVRLDLTMVGQSRRNREMRDLAESAVMEVMNNSGLYDLLPSLDTSGSNSLSTAFPTASASPLNDPNHTYSAEIHFLRTVNVNESSLSLTKGFVYEVVGNGTMVTGDANGEVRAEFTRTVAIEPGTVFPSVHYR